MSDEKFIEPLQKAGLGDYIESILQHKKSCIRLHANPVNDPRTLPLGASRIGGLPDLPPQASWPIRNGRPCEFIAQIDLSEASQYDEAGLLPSEGWLLFFFDGRSYDDEIFKPYQTGGETILYYTGPVTSLERTHDYPVQLVDWQRYNTCTITYETDWMIPHWWCHAAILLEQDVFQKSVHDPKTPDVEAYREVAYDLIPDRDGDKHHLFGLPEPCIQDDPLYDVSHAWDGKQIDEEKLAAWILLLQISSDGGPGMLWGDTSSLYYCIRKNDLIARRFENAGCVLQFY